MNTLGVLRGDEHPVNKLKQPPEDQGRDLQKLRELLLGAERRELEELRRKVDEQELLPEQVMRVLPAAILRRTPGDPSLPQALAPIIEDALERSVQRNPRPLTEAIFPIIGPAIRKSIRHSLLALTKNINRTLEQSLSLRGIGWRIEAMRTGRPFADVVLKHSVQFRVEQVFLIHSETSLLLEHVTAPTAAAKDADMVSSMLGAIQDFASESFDQEGDGSIAQIEFGDLSLLLARGPRAVLACAVRGVPVASLREELDSALEEIHRQHALDLAKFDGDVLPFATTRSRLEALLQEQLARPEGPRSKKGAGLLALSLFALLAVAAVFVVRRWDTNERWSHSLAKLRDEPGILLLSAEREDGRFRVTGMRDPLASDPDSLLAEQRIDLSRVDAHWEPFYSVQPSFVMRRARVRLDPPQGVAIALVDSELRVTGEASHAWVQHLQREASDLPGVLSIDDRDLVDLDVEAALELVRTFEGLQLPFAAGSHELAEESEPVHSLVEAFRKLELALRKIEADWTVLAIGHSTTHEEGAAELEHKRARAAFDLLQPASIGAARLGTIAVGVSGSRAVSFRVQIPDACSSPGQ